MLKDAEAFVSRKPDSLTALLMNLFLQNEYINSGFLKLLKYARVNIFAHLK